MADNKVTTYAVAFLLVGLVIGVAVGYGVFHTDSAEKNETYWFYIDYGMKADATHVNGWYSGEATNTVDAFKKSFDKAKIAYELGDGGWVKILNGITSENSNGWHIWSWDSVKFNSIGTKIYSSWFAPNVAMGDSVGNVFYLGFFNYDPVTNKPVAGPYDNLAGWSTSGPFKA